MLPCSDARIFAARHLYPGSSPSPRSCPFSLVHGAGALPPGIRLLHLDTSPDRPARRLLHQRQCRPSLRGVIGFSAHRDVEAPWRSVSFTIVEEGAEDGQLALDILSAITEESSEAAACIRYTILEPIPEKQRQQRARLEPAFLEKVTWLSGLTDLENVTGVFISNELVDAMPVHIVLYRNGRWSELRVDISGQDFCFVPAKIEAPELVQATDKIPAPVASPYRTEVNLAATRWIQAVSTRLERGFVLIVDYGFPRDEYYKPERTEGTLSCYSRHRRSYNPLERPGEIDITAHVDFTSLAEAAEKASLRVAGYVDQHHFMVGAAESRLLALEKAVETGRIGTGSLGVSRPVPNADASWEHGHGL